MATKKISDLTLISAMADDVNLPGENTSQTYRVTGAQLKTYIQTGIADLMKEAKNVYNLGLAASVGSNALTISLKQLDGSSDPSSSAPVKIGFRGTTQANGDASLVSATAATSLVISSGSTLGFANATAEKIYVYALNNAGTIELAASASPWDESTLQTTTAEGGAGAADSRTVLYSTTARTTKAIRLIGIITATEATAGTWATAPSSVEVAPVSSPRKPPTLQSFTSGSGNYTVPTPAPLYLRVRAVGQGGGGSGGGTAGGTAATNGTDTTFGSSLLTAGGGVKGAYDAAGGGAGGAATIASPAYGFARQGNHGGVSIRYASSVLRGSSGYGGASPMGSGGSGEGTGAGTGASKTAVANTGGGGGGGDAGSSAGAVAGTGGGSGGYVDAIIPNPVAGATYAYVVGSAAGAAGAAGTGTAAGAGGAGGSGLIIVEEFYQ